MKIQIPFLLIIYFSALTISAQSLELPNLTKRVTDQTGTLSDGEQQALEQKLSYFEKNKGSQVVVVIIPSTEDETIEQYAIRLADQWKIGRGEIDDGVIMLFAMSDRKMRIEVGYGLEGALTDALSKRIITNVITPEFQSGQFYRGINNGVDIVLSVINGEELPPIVSESKATHSSGNPLNKLIMPLIVLALVGIGILKSLLGKKYGKGKVTGNIAVILFTLAWVFISLGAAIFVTLITSIFLAIPGGRGGRGGGGIFMGGGGYGGFSGGGGGFGGFSGGGGGFGGGGASGSW